MNKRQSLALLFSIFSALLASHANASLSSEDYPDLYGSVLFDKAPVKGMDVAAQRGYGDNYGSILLDPTPKKIIDAPAHPGYGDNYGSILLDLPSKNTTHIVVQHTKEACKGNI
jgi:hypothetical protein